MFSSLTFSDFFQYTVQTFTRNLLNESLNTRNTQDDVKENCIDNIDSTKIVKKSSLRHSLPTSPTISLIPLQYGGRLSLCLHIRHQGKPRKVSGLY